MPAVSFNRMATTAGRPPIFAERPRNSSNSVSRDAAVGRGFEHRIRPVACDGDPHVGEIQRPFFARRRRDRPGHLRVFSGLEEQVARVQAIAVLAAGNGQQKHTYIY